jgi:SNF2 family DNA or RNA helicase
MTVITTTPTLHPHQTEAVAFLLERPKAILADDPGLGKTAVAAAYLTRLIEAEQLPHRGKKRMARCLCVTDARLIEQTRRELERFAPGLMVRTTADPEFGDGKKAALRLRELSAAGFDVLITSYEKANQRRNWLDGFEFSCLVCDEASSGLRGGKVIPKTIRSIAKRTPRVIGLTATLMENHPGELRETLLALDMPNVWSEDEFGRMVTWRTQGVNRWGREVRVPDRWVSPEVEFRVRDYLREVVLRRTAAEAGMVLPERAGEQLRWIGLAPDQQRVYDRAPEGTSGYHQRQRAVLDSPDAPILDVLVAELRRHTPAPVIVYSEYLEAGLDHIAERLDREGITYVRIDGNVTGQNRTEAVARFVNGDVRILLGNKVLERGLNLQSCRVLISLGTSWNPAREAQREGRICRIGSPHETYEHLVVVPDTPQGRAQQNRLAHKLAPAEAVGLT